MPATTAQRRKWHNWRPLLAVLAALALAGAMTVPVRVAQASTPGPSYDQLYAWGGNGYGQLGIGSTELKTTPQAVTGFPAGVHPTTTIAAGVEHSLALGSDGQLYAWGWNLYGQLGIGSNVDQTTPQAVTTFPAGVHPTAIAAGYGHSLALGSDGQLYAWGENYYGELGIGSTTNQATPVAVTTFPVGVHPTTIAAGSVHSLALGSDGQLYAWGNNSAGQLGIGSTELKTTPQAVTGFPAGVHPTTTIAGGSHSLVLGSDGQLYAWGRNDYGELGIGSTELKTTPQAVTTFPAGVHPTTTIAAGGGFGEHSLALGDNGTLYAWGDNGYGQLGIGSSGENTNKTTPQAVTTFPAGVHPTTIVAGYGHSLALGSEGASDTTPPTISITTPADGATYLYGQTVNAAYICTDNESGVASCEGTVPSGSPITTSTVGQHAFTVTATDKAGNTVSKSISYGVALDWGAAPGGSGGVMQPINATGSSIFKLGSVVPVKFQLSGASASISPVPMVTLYVKQLSNNPTGTVTEADAPGQADTGNQFRYDPTTHQYTYNLSTKGLQAGDYELQIYAGGDKDTGVLQGQVQISLK